MTSLIAANNASSSASASRTTGAADFVVVILRGTNTHPAATWEQLPGAGRDARHPRWPPPVSGDGSPGREHVPLLARRGEDDDRQQAGAFVRADAGRLAGAPRPGRAPPASTPRTPPAIASRGEGLCPEAGARPGHPRRGD